MYSLNKDKLNDFYNTLLKNKVEITKFKENYIEGKINLDSDSSIFTSIPYDEGWRVYNNDKRVRTYKINDSLLGFDVGKGKNKITLKYIPNNTDIGLSISITTLIITISYLLIHKKINHQD